MGNATMHLNAMWFRNVKIIRMLFYLMGGIVSIFTVYVLCMSSVEHSRYDFGETPKPRWKDTLRFWTTRGNDFSRYQNGTYCNPRKNIVFLKVHKCSSSTVQNILLRYGDKHNLNFVLPPKYNYLGDMRNTTFHRKYMMELPVNEYNILCHHTRFNEQNIVEVMPSDSVYVSVLRHPVTMFESIFTYYKYHLPLQIGGTNPVEKLAQFLKYPRQYYDFLLNTEPKISNFIGHCKNPMLYDFGLPNKHKFNNSYIDEMIEKLSRRFDLVMMTEYFYESLILLKELMCWSIDDVVFFQLNSRTRSTVPSSIASDIAEKTRKWNDGDVKLYNHFNETFWRKVRDFGIERMKKEVEVLKEVNEYLYRQCVEKVKMNDTNVWHPKDVFIDTLEIRMEMRNEHQCVAMAKPELNYTEDIRQNLMRKYNLRTGLFSFLSFNFSRS